MISPGIKDVMPFPDTCWKRIFLLIGKMHHLSSMIEIKKSFKWLYPLSYQRCPTLICLQVCLPGNIEGLMSRSFIFNDPLLYFNIHVALLVDTYFPSIIMLLELMPRGHTLPSFLFCLLAYRFVLLT